MCKPLFSGQIEFLNCSRFPIQSDIWIHLKSVCALWEVMWNELWKQKLHVRVYQHQLQCHSCSCSSQWPRHLICKCPFRPIFKQIIPFHSSIFLLSLIRIQGVLIRLIISLGFIVGKHRSKYNLIRNILPSLGFHHTSVLWPISYWTQRKIQMALKVFKFNIRWCKCSYKDMFPLGPAGGALCSLTFCGTLLIWKHCICGEITSESKRSGVAV